MKWIFARTGKTTVHFSFQVSVHFHPCHPYVTYRRSPANRFSQAMESSTVCQCKFEGSQLVSVQLLPFGHPPFFENQHWRTQERQERAENRLKYMYILMKYFPVSSLSFVGFFIRFC